MNLFSYEVAALLSLEPMYKSFKRKIQMQLIAECLG